MRPNRGDPFFTLSVLSVVVQTVIVAGEDTVVDGVVGEASPQVGWANSYQGPDGNCWCAPDIDFTEGQRRHTVVPAPGGQWWSLPDVCAALGPGPGIVEGETPLYNDIQCGRGPPAAIKDELTCPGRVDIGTRAGCGQFGPYWDLRKADASKATDRLLPKPAEAHPDIVSVIDVVGMRNPRGINWTDSYSVGDECYCATTFDHGIDVYMVETPTGYMSIKDVCDLLGPGPGIEEGVTPIYNDIQCGNGPPNNALDEQRCPGRVDIGKEGCGHIGPKWNFGSINNDSPTEAPKQILPTPTPSKFSTSTETGAPSSVSTKSPTMGSVATNSPAQLPTKGSSGATTSPTQSPAKGSPTTKSPTTSLETPTTLPIGMTEAPSITEGTTAGPSGEVPTTQAGPQTTASPTTGPTSELSTFPPSVLPSIVPSKTTSTGEPGLASSSPPSMNPPLPQSEPPTAPSTSFISRSTIPSESPSMVPVSKSVPCLQHWLVVVLSACLTAMMV